MDYSIKVDNNGIGQMSWDKAEDITTNVWYSTNIEQGSFFQNFDFGLLLRDINKITDSTIDLFKQRLESAVNWLLNIERADKIDIIVEKDQRDINRVNYKIEITPADGFPVTVTGFQTVGGASDDFTL